MINIQYMLSKNNSSLMEHFFGPRRDQQKEGRDLNFSNFLKDIELHEFVHSSYL